MTTDIGTDAALEAIRALEPFLRHMLAEDAPDGGWSYDPDSPMAVNPRIRAALALLGGEVHITERAAVLAAAEWLEHGAPTAAKWLRDDYLPTLGA